ncbi:conserved hypothetical protein [Thermus scotoductus SA-01]|uniref:Uncharacterized protein n=1 Tax=Thermus scotoductus (strain ATCC 700910 / SA-01) TaxID=743525 RepID=E8PQU1_THESS|nr:conserved hypothetical protein [Thermus scotoductus SA-01]
MRGDYEGALLEEVSRAGPSPHAWGLRWRWGLHWRLARAIPTCVGTTRFSLLGDGGVAGHPHMRGDYPNLAATSPNARGPSPHAWGLRPKRNMRRGFFRAIPTCVGTTARCPVPWRSNPGHPHMRGDYAPFTTAPRITAGHPHMRGDYSPGHQRHRRHHGPSPHAWGLRLRPARGAPGARAIPTCVGTTVQGLIAERALRGPSPHAWGLRTARRGALRVGRAIPTCVGTTAGDPVAGGRRPGHPHMRGDYVWPYREDDRVIRAIPTCVGTTEYQARVGGGVRGPSPHAWGLLHPCGATWPPPPGHPHMRGDYFHGGDPHGFKLGPSPHAWGLRAHARRRPRPHRAIPTCVGTTTRIFSRDAWEPGHPHMRGDYCGFCGSRRFRSGPSPHAWGLRRGAYGQPGGARAIPTCVGTTPVIQQFVMRGPGPSPHAWGLRAPGPGGLTSCAGHPHMRGDYARTARIPARVPGPSPHAWGLHMT